jgi:hypothetical protein
MRALTLKSIVAAAFVLVVSGSVAAQAPARKLQITFDNQGNVTLIAEGVTVNDILREWTRVGGSQFPGSEKLVSTMLPPVQFENHPEAEVLKSLLRSAAGYMIAPRPKGSAGPSRFNVLMVATSTATASSSGYSSPSSPGVPVVTPGVIDEEPPPSVGQVQGVVQGKDAQPAGARPAPGYGGPAPITVPVIQPIGTVPQSGTPKTDPQPPMSGTTGRGGGPPK